MSSLNTIIYLYFFQHEFDYFRVLYSFVYISSFVEHCTTLSLFSDLKTIVYGSTTYKYTYVHKYILKKHNSADVTDQSYSLSEALAIMKTTFRTPYLNPLYVTPPLGNSTSMSAFTCRYSGTRSI